MSKSGAPCKGPPLPDATTEDLVLALMNKLLAGTNTILRFRLPRSGEEIVTVVARGPAAHEVQRRIADLLKEATMH